MRLSYRRSRRRRIPFVLVSAVAVCWKNVNRNLTFPPQPAHADIELIFEMCRKFFPPSSFHADIELIFEMCRKFNSGAKAKYIPELEKQDGSHWAVAICTIDGQRMHCGDTSVPFCLQSCSKPITYCMALENVGPDHTHMHVGCEPSGMIFNAMALDRRVSWGMECPCLFFPGSQEQDQRLVEVQEQRSAVHLHQEQRSAVYRRVRSCSATTILRYRKDDPYLSVVCK